MTSKNGGVYEPLLATDADIENNDNKNSKNALSLEDAATSFSRTFLNYLSPLFDLGMKRELELVDLGSPSEQDKCEALYERFNTQWEEEVKNKKGDLKRLSLWNPLWSMVGRFYAFQCIFLYYIYAIFSYGPVLILSQLVNHLQGTTTLSTAYLWTYVSLMFVFPIISSLSMNQSNIIIAHISVQFRNALVMKIYRKALSLSPASRQKHSTGQIINMFANDTKQIQGFLFFYNNLYCAPAQIILTLYLIYLQVGVSTFAGLGYMLITSPLIGVILSMLNATRKLKSKETDKRVKFMNEILAGIRVIKYYAWEAAFKEKVEAIRFQELKYIKRIQYVFAVAFSLLFLATPIMLPVLVFFVFIKLGNELDSATAFTTIALFGLLQMPLLFLPIALVNYSQACVSMDRIKAFLVCTELDQYVQTHAVHQPRVENNDGSDLKKPVDKFADAPIVVQLRSVSACWTLPGEESETDPKSGTKKPKKDDVDIIRPLMKTIAQPSKGSFSLKPFSRRTISENISTRTAPTQRSWGLRWMGDRPPEKNPSVSASIPEDGENEEEDESASAVRSLLGATSMKSSSQQLIVTGSTKTLSDINITIKQGQLVAIVGTVGSGKSSLLNLLLGEMHLTSGSVSMRGSVAYCDQKPWIRNCTVQENILFDTPMDEDRFQAALEASSLIDDIKILPGGVHTEIGERGINLSGGQKARVALARAVYQDADCYVLDDPLSAVDAHVGQHIFEKCLCGALVKKTRLLVTHSVHLLPQCDVIIIMEGGAVKAWGSYDDLRNSGFDISAFVPSGSTANTITDVETSTEGDEALSEPSEQNPSEDEMKDSHVDRNTWQSVDAADPTSHTRTKGNNTPKGTPKSAHKTVDKDGIDASDKEAAPTLAPQSTQLIKDEEKGVGAVDLSIYKYYLKFAGAFNVTVIIVCLFMQQVCTVLASFYLSYWGTRSVEREEDGNEMSGNTNLQYLFVYSLLCVGGVVFLMFRSVSLAQMSNLASIKIHTALLNRVLAAPVAFFDVTPLGRIVNRFSSDLATIDESLMQSWSQVLQNILGILAAVVSIAIATNGIFIILLIPLTYLYLKIQVVFRRTNTAVARIESVSRSPLYADFSETLNGLNTIRAYRNQSNCIKKLETGLNKNTIAVMIVQLVGNWLGLRLDIMGGAIIFFIAALAVISDSYFSNDFIPAGYLALGLTYSFSMTIYLKFTVRMVATLEAQMNNVERVKFYSESIDNEQSVIPPSDPDIYDEEGGWKQLGSPVNHHPFSKPLLGDDKNASDSLRPYTPPVLPSNWPVQGAVEGINLEMRYRDGPLVLKGISFKVAPGEKVGIAGRTGSGKSSLMNALFRMQELSGGKITIDGYDISTVPLTTLRSRVGIIPQDPVMFSSTVRFNLDPFDKCTDDEIWNILESVDLKSYILSLPNQLQEEVAEGGENFSAGQRQLICISRALLRKPKILVLDEATASIDNETDELIQRLVRISFKDCTVLTIAHRLNTIIDSDRVMVLDQGNMMEFDSPDTLLSNPHGMFRALWDRHKASHNQH